MAVTNTITRHNITWTFDTNYTYGTFANGDYWVLDPGSGVIISAITNSYHSYPGDGYDGSMINPVPGYSQGYVGNVNLGYDSSLNVRLSLPIALGGGDSLVSSVTYHSSDPPADLPNWNTTLSSYRPALREVAILTCVSAAPPNNGADCFRPPYTGPNKPYSYYRTTALREHLLPDLDGTGATGLPSYATAESWFEHSWIDEMPGHVGSYLHPELNMIGVGFLGYGFDMAGQLGVGALMLLLDESTVPGGDRTRLLINFVQVGIDLYGILDNGGFWPSHGGFCLGRKMPILFAGYMLDDDDMLSITYDDLPVINGVNKPGTIKDGYPLGEAYFQEDGDTFYVTQADVDQDHSNCDTRTTGSCFDYTVEEIGEPRWGIRHSAIPSQDNNHPQAQYISLNGPAYTGHALVALALGLVEEWNHNAFFDWTNRWAYDIGPQYWSTVFYKNYANGFTEWMCDQYWDTYYPPPDVGSSAKLVMILS